MIRRLLAFFRPRYTYDNQLDVQRAQAMLFVLGLSLVGTVVYSSILLFYVVFLGSTVVPTMLAIFASPIVVALAYFMVHRGYLRASVVALIALSMFAGYIAVFRGVNDVAVLTLALPIMISGVMLDWRGTLITIAVTVALLIQISFFSPQASAENITQDFVVLSVLLLISGGWITVFSANTRASARQSLANVDDLKTILQRVAQTGINTDEHNLSADVIDIVRDRLGYTYARIFLLNDDGQISQSVAVGLNKSQLNVDSNVRVGSESAIYEAARSNTTVLLQPNSGEARRGHLLPGIASAAAVPIRVEHQLVGILDIQHEDEQNFKSDAIDLLELLADHLGGTIVQSRIINELRSNLSEQNALVLNQREKLLEYERAEERATISTWTTYLQQRGFDYLGFDMQSQDAEPKLSYALTPELRPALETGDISVITEGDFQIVSVPILLRGRTLGAMSFKVAIGSQSIGGRQQELVRSVVQRLGLALENKRLLEQSRAQAQRESKANEVGSLLLSSTDIEAVLNLAAQNFNEALGAVQTKIHLQPENRRTSEG